MLSVASLILHGLAVQRLAAIVLNGPPGPEIAMDRFREEQMKRWMVLLALVFLGSAAAQADSLSVYVGYTDTLRSSGFFPTPFCSAFGSSCQVQQGALLDGGAFLIDNTGSNPVTISDITVTLNPTAAPTTFALWSSVTIAPGGMAIFGQTAQWNFDTSDYPLVGSSAGSSINGIGGCTTLSALSAAQQAMCIANFPIISFKENGDQVSITDSGSILNTGSYDPFFAFPGENESINWNLAGSTGERSGTAVPEPNSVALLASGTAILAAFVLLKRTHANAALK